VKVLETQAANARIAAPVSGVVTSRLIDVGGMASPAQPILVIANARRRLVRIAVSERDLRHLQTGMAAAVTSVAYPGRVFSGRLIETAPALDPQSHDVPAKIQLPAGSPLKFGMSVTVRLLAPARRALLVPLGAVRRDSGSQVVYLAEGGRVRRVEVQSGSRTATAIEILAGLRSGDPVVDRGSDLVRDGDTVRTATERPL
jgi:RND family efflux transporter MFP subunit